MNTHFINPKSPCYPTTVAKITIRTQKLFGDITTYPKNWKPGGAYRLPRVRREGAFCSLKVPRAR